LLIQQELKLYLFDLDLNGKVIAKLL